jgi:hypothetical protein
LSVAAAAVLLIPGLAVQLPVMASNPPTATISYAHPSQVFVQSAPMNGGSRAGLVQTICNDPAEPTACDPVTFNVDPALPGGAVDHSALLTVNFVPASPNQMAVAQYPPGCPEDTNPTGSCATYMQTAPPYSFPDPGRTQLRLKVVCQVCVNGTYQLTATLTHFDITSKLPNAGSPTAGFVTTVLPDPTQPPGAAGAGPGQLTSQYGEPGIWINQKGYGIVNTFGPSVWITRDGGKTYSQPYDIIQNDTFCQSKYAGDADAVVGIDNTFYADNLCLGTDGGVNNESFTNTASGAPAQWGGPHLAGGVSDRQWYTPDPSDPNTIYFSFHGFTPDPNINVFKSTDKGLDWFCPRTGLAVTAATSTVDCPVTATSGGNVPLNTTYLDTGLGNVTTRPVIDPTDPKTIYVPYADAPALHAASALATRKDNDLTRFRMAVSHDGGVHWLANTDSTGQGVVFDSEDGKYFPVTNTNPVDGTMDSTIAHIFIGTTIDSAGNLYILFSLRLGGATPTHLYMMSSKDHGKTWSAPNQVDSGGLKSNTFPTIKAGDPGRVAMAWYGSISDDFNKTDSLWGEMYAVTTNGLDAHPSFTQTRVSGNTPVHAADMCQAGTFCAVTGGNRNLADYQTVVNDPCGMPVIVYTDDHAPAAHTVISRLNAGTSLYANGCAGPQSFLKQPTTVSTAGGGTPTTSRAPAPPPLSVVLALVLAALAALVVLRGARAGAS